MEGWRPPHHRRRTLRLPIELDEEVRKWARQYRCTPSALVGDALKFAVEELWLIGDAGWPGPRGPQLTVALPPGYDVCYVGDLSGMAPPLVFKYLRYLAFKRKSPIYSSWGQT